MNESNAQFKPFERLLAALTLIFFSLNSLAYAAPNIGLRASPPEIHYENLLSRIVIPEELGTVQERFLSRSLKPAPLVVHIQDAHANFEAQRNIQALIEHLHKTYGFSLVLLEGGVEKLDPTLLQVFKNPKYNAEMIDLLVKKGEMSGPQSYLVSQAYENENSIDSFGLESKEAYVNDLEQFRKIWGDTETGRATIKKLIQLIDRAGSRVMNKELRGFLKEWQSYKESRSHLNSYLNYIQKTSQEVLNLDLSDPRNQKDWPILLRIFKLKEIEPKLNLEQAKTEWRKAKEVLTAQQIDSGLVKEIETRLNSQNKKSSIDMESARSLFERLLDVAFPKGFTFKNYPQLSLWVGHVLLKNEINGEEIFKEIDRLNDLIANQLAPTQNEKQIVELMRQSFLLQDLFALELTRENYLRIQAGPELFSPLEVAARIEKIDSTTPSHVFENIHHVQKLYFECLKSYEFATLRETEFFKNIKRAFQTTKKDKAITITGGFHTRAFTQGFRESNISYLVISPRITTFEDVEKEHQNYVSSLLQLTPKAIAARSLRSAEAYIDSTHTNPNWRAAQVARSEMRVIGAHDLSVRNLDQILLPNRLEIDVRAERNQLIASIGTRSELRAPFDSKGVDENRITETVGRPRQITTTNNINIGKGQFKVGSDGKVVLAPQVEVRSELRKVNVILSAAKNLQRRMLRLRLSMARFTVLAASIGIGACVEEAINPIADIVDINAVNQAPLTTLIGGENELGIRDPIFVGAASGASKAGEEIGIVKGLEQRDSVIWPGGYDIEVSYDLTLKPGVDWNLVTTYVTNIDINQIVEIEGRKWLKVHVGFKNQSAQPSAGKRVLRIVIKDQEGRTFESQPVRFDNESDLEIPIDVTAISEQSNLADFDFSKTVLEFTLENNYNWAGFANRTLDVLTAQIPSNAIDLGLSALGWLQELRSGVWVPDANPVGKMIVTFGGGNIRHLIETTSGRGANELSGLPLDSSKGIPTNFAGAEALVISPEGTSGAVSFTPVARDPNDPTDLYDQQEVIFDPTKAEWMVVGALYPSDIYAGWLQVSTDGAIYLPIKLSSNIKTVRLEIKTGRDSGERTSVIVLTRKPGQPENAWFLVETPISESLEPGAAESGFLNGVQNGRLGVSAFFIAVDRNGLLNPNQITTFRTAFQGIKFVPNDAIAKLSRSELRKRDKKNQYQIILRWRAIRAATLTAAIAGLFGCVTEKTIEEMVEPEAPVVTNVSTIPSIRLGEGVTVPNLELTNAAKAQYFAINAKDQAVIIANQVLNDRLPGIAEQDRAWGVQVKAGVSGNINDAKYYVLAADIKPELIEFNFGGTSKKFKPTLEGELEVGKWYPIFVEDLLAQSNVRQELGENVQVTDIFIAWRGDSPSGTSGFAAQNLANELVPPAISRVELTLPSSPFSIDGTDLKGNKLDGIGFGFSPTIQPNEFAGQPAQDSLVEDGFLGPRFSGADLTGLIARVKVPNAIQTVILNIVYQNTEGKLKQVESEIAVSDEAARSVLVNEFEIREQLMTQVTGLVRITAINLLGKVPVTGDIEAADLNFSVAGKNVSNLPNAIQADTVNIFENVPALNTTGNPPGIFTIGNSPVVGPIFTMLDEAVRLVEARGEFSGFGGIVFEADFVHNDQISFGLRAGQNIGNTGNLTYVPPVVEVFQSERVLSYIVFNPDIANPDASLETPNFPVVTIQKSQLIGFDTNVPVGIRVFYNSAVLNAARTGVQSDMNNPLEINLMGSDQGIIPVSTGRSELRGSFGVSARKLNLLLSVLVSIVSPRFGSRVLATSLRSDSGLNAGTLPANRSLEVDFQVRSQTPIIVRKTEVEITPKVPRTVRSQISRNVKLSPSIIHVAELTGILPESVVRNPNLFDSALTAMGFMRLAFADQAIDMNRIDQVVRQLSGLFATSSQVAGQVTEILSAEELNIDSFDMALFAAAINPKLKLVYLISGIQEGALEQFENSLIARLKQARTKLGIAAGDGSQIQVSAAPTNFEVLFRSVRNSFDPKLRGNTVVVTSRQDVLNRLKTNLGVAKLDKTGVPLQHSESNAVRLIANEMALGLRQVDSSEIYSAVKLIGLILEAVQRAELRIAIAA